MSARVVDRLSDARRQRFVGRASERELFRESLAGPKLPFQVLFVHGPGGVGKTTLLQEFALAGIETGASVVLLDGRTIEPTPGAFVEALRTGIGAQPNESPLDALAARGGRSVVLVDTYETLAVLDGWLRDVLLPQAAEHTLFVLAGRDAPSLGWRADPGWGALVRAVPLRNFSPDEARAYLGRREVPSAQHEPILDFTHGHPLALSLVGELFEQRGDLEFRPESAPDVVHTLVQQLVQRVPGPAQRAALEACACVRTTSESLLAALLGMPEAHEVFEWLRSLAFVEAGPLGLYPHDLAREALTADVRWRNPDWYRELHHRARTYYTERLQGASLPEQQRILSDYIFLHRDNPVVRPFLQSLQGGGSTTEEGSLIADRIRPGDVPILEAMATRHEGRESARLLSSWIERQPESFLVLRELSGRPGGVLASLALDRVSDEAADDPAVSAARKYLAQRSPLRSGETATLFRFWMAEEAYQAPSPSQGLIFVHMVRHYLTTPGLAFTFLPCANPDFWAPMFGYADLARLPEADFEIGGRRYGVYGHDWRAVPPTAWLDLLAEREISMGAQQEPAAGPAAAPLLVLSRQEFDAAVRDGLRSALRPQTLRENPLLRSRLIVERTGPAAPVGERAEALQTLLSEAADQLKRVPREAKLFEVLDRTYFRPAATQELAAQLLDLPFSTYRRHLKTGIARVADNLWDRELEGSGL